MFQDQGAVDEKAQIRSHTLYARSGLRSVGGAERRQCDWSLEAGRVLD